MESGVVRTYVGVHAWEPDLAEGLGRLEAGGRGRMVGDGGWATYGLIAAGFLPYGGDEGCTPLVEREGLEGVLDAVAEAGVEEAVFFHSAALEAEAFEPGNAGDAEGACWGV